MNCFARFPRSACLENFEQIPVYASEGKFRMLLLLSKLLNIRDLTGLLVGD